MYVIAAKPQYYLLPTISTSQKSRKGFLRGKNKEVKSEIPTAYAIGIFGADTQKRIVLKTLFSLKSYFNIFSNTSPITFAIDAKPRSVGWVLSTVPSFPAICINFSPSIK